MTRKRKVKFGYKIVRHIDKKYYSLFPDGKRIEYKVKEWTRRPERCGPLAVFKTAKDVRRFIINVSLIVICFLSKYLDADIALIKM